MFEFTRNFDGNSPAMSEAIRQCEMALGASLPDDFRTFLERHDGGEGFVGTVSYLMLWAVAEIVPFNRDYEVDQYCPALLLFGSSGGGEAYAFDRRQHPWSVVQVPFIGMDYAYCEPLGGSFTDFLARLASES